MDRPCTKLLEGMEFIAVREHPEWLERAVAYFSSKWRVPPEVYRASMMDAIDTTNPIPRWYLLVKNDEILGSFGLIENDFMVRRDLVPWLCAVYIEPAWRGRQLGSCLLDYGRTEAGKAGYDTVYLCTDHVGYYERYGWAFLGMNESEDGDLTRVYWAPVLSQSEAARENQAIVDSPQG